MFSDTFLNRPLYVYFEKHDSFSISSEYRVRQLYTYPGKNIHEVVVFDSSILVLDTNLHHLIILSYLVNYSISPFSFLFSI